MPLDVLLFWTPVDHASQAIVHTHVAEVVAWFDCSEEPRRSSTSASVPTPLHGLLRVDLCDDPPRPLPTHAAAAATHLRARLQGLLRGTLRYRIRLSACARLEAYDARLASGDALLGYSGLRRTAISCLVLLRALPGHAVRASYAVC